MKSFATFACTFFTFRVKYADTSFFTRVVVHAHLTSASWKQFEDARKCKWKSLDDHLAQSFAEFKFSRSSIEKLLQTPPDLPPVFLFSDFFSHNCFKQLKFLFFRIRLQWGSWHCAGSDKCSRKPISVHFFQTYFCRRFRSILCLTQQVYL